MSLLWPNAFQRTVLMGVAPEALTLTFRSQKNTAARTPISIPLSAPGPAGLALAVNNVGELLSALPEMKTQIRVVLSNHFVRYIVLRPADKIQSSEGLRNLAAAMLEDRFGALAREWEIVVSPPSRRQISTLACGMPSDWVTNLKERLPDWISVTTIRPLLPLVFNRTCREIGARAGHLLILEPERMTAARFDNHEWNWVSSRAYATDHPDAIVQMLREAADEHFWQESLPLWYADISGRQTVDPSLGSQIKRVLPGNPQEITGLAAWGDS